MVKTFPGVSKPLLPRLVIVETCPSESMSVHGERTRNGSSWAGGVLQGGVTVTQPPNIRPSIVQPVSNRVSHGLTRTGIRW